MDPAFLALARNPLAYAALTLLAALVGYQGGRHAVLSREVPGSTLDDGADGIGARYQAFRRATGVLVMTLMICLGLLLVVITLPPDRAVFRWFGWRPATYDLIIDGMMAALFAVVANRYGWRWAARGLWLKREARGLWLKREARGLTWCIYNGEYHRASLIEADGTITPDPLTRAQRIYIQRQWAQDYLAQRGTRVANLAGGCARAAVMVAMGWGLNYLLSNWVYHPGWLLIAMAVALLPTEELAEFAMLRTDKRAFEANRQYLPFAKVLEPAQPVPSTETVGAQRPMGDARFHD